MQPTPQHLANLFKQTHEMLRLYYNKSQWPSIYPLLSKQAEQFYNLYETHPNALQAQLCLYVSDFGYTTNLVVNQCVIVAALCKSLNYNSQVSQQLIAVCLTNYLCVQTQTNKLAAQQPLNNEEKKQWQARHQLAVKLLQSANLPSTDIARILAPLNKYKQALLSAPKIMIYDGATTLVALANIIAMNITYRAANDHVNLYKAIADIYIRTPNSFAQNALKKLVENIGPYLPGSHVNIAEQSLTYVCSKTHNKHILIDLNDTKRARWHGVAAKLDCNAKQRPTKDKRLLFSIWFNEHIPAVDSDPINEQDNILQLIGNLKIQKEYSYRNLEKLLNGHTKTIDSLKEAVKPYNKEHLAAKDLRHCLTMVGIDNAPAIIQRVLFEQLVDIQRHPLKEHIKVRLTAITRLLSLLLSKQTEIQFEQVSLPLYAYINYLLTHSSNKLSRKTLCEKDPKTNISLPISWLFGVNNHNVEELSVFLLQLLDDNPWTQALLDAEQQTKQHLSAKAKLWVALKVITLNVYQPHMPNSSWQKQTLDTILKDLGWESITNFYAQLPPLHLSSSV